MEAEVCGEVCDWCVRACVFVCNEPWEEEVTLYMLVCRGWGLYVQCSWEHCLHYKCVEPVVDIRFQKWSDIMSDHIGS